MFSEIGQTQKDKDHISSHIHSLVLELHMHVCVCAGYESRKKTMEEGTILSKG